MVDDLVNERNEASGSLLSVLKPFSHWVSHLLSHGLQITFKFIEKSEIQGKEEHVREKDERINS